MNESKLESQVHNTTSSNCQNNCSGVVRWGLRKDAEIGRMTHGVQYTLYVAEIFSVRGNTMSLQF